MNTYVNLIGNATLFSSTLIELSFFWPSGLLLPSLLITLIHLFQQVIHYLNIVISNPVNLF